VSIDRGLSIGHFSGDSVYAGMAVRGEIREVMLRGQIIVSNGTLVNHDPTGMYLRAVTVEEGRNAR